MNVARRRGIHQKSGNRNFSKKSTNEEFNTVSESNSSNDEELLKNEENISDSSDDNSPHKYVNRKLPEVRDDTKCSETNQSHAKYIYILGIIFVISITSACYYFVSKNNNSDCSRIPSCNFKNLYKQLQGEFQNQNEWSWRVIHSAVYSVINSSRHVQPAVILLVADKHAGDVLSCLANRLAYSLEESFNNQKGYPRLNPLEDTSSPEMKEKIDATFRESFENNDHHVILLERLDSLSADTAMILHSYCDNENAPYKDVVILMTAATNTSVKSSELTTNKMDQIAWRHLDSTWESQLREEKRAALLSRITTSVALVFPEDPIPQTCKEYITH